MKIPQDIIGDFEKRKEFGSPVFAVRALTDVYGNIGETYVLGDSESLLFYSGKLGEAYKFFEFPFRSIQQLEVEDERPFTYLILLVNDQKIRLKFAVFDSNILNNIVEHWQNINSMKTGGPSASSEKATDFADRPTSSQRTTDLPTLKPFVGFCAALQAVAHIDAKPTDKERKSLSLIIDDEHLLKKGFDYWQQVGTEQLGLVLRDILSPEQKLCLMANLLEVAMVDGILQDDEKIFVETLRKSLDVDVTKFNAVFDVLLIKNNLTIF